MDFPRLLIQRTAVPLVGFSLNQSVIVLQSSLDFHDLNIPEENLLGVLSSVTQSGVAHCFFMTRMVFRVLRKNTAQLKYASHRMISEST